MPVLQEPMESPKQGALAGGLKLTVSDSAASISLSTGTAMVTACEPPLARVTVPLRVTSPPIPIVAQPTVARVVGGLAPVAVRVMVKVTVSPSFTWVPAVVVSRSVVESATATLKLRGIARKLTVTTASVEAGVRVLLKPPP